MPVITDALANMVLDGKQVLNLLQSVKGEGSRISGFSQLVCVLPSPAVQESRVTWVTVYLTFFAMDSFSVAGGYGIASVTSVVSRRPRKRWAQVARVREMISNGQGPDSSLNSEFG